LFIGRTVFTLQICAVFFVFAPQGTLFLGVLLLIGQVWLLRNISTTLTGYNPLVLNILAGAMFLRAQTKMN
jgi:hypothetical protein